MKRKVLTTLMAMAVLVVVAMLGATIVSAADGSPTECTDGTFTVTPASNEIPRPAVGTECQGKNAYVWEYKITSDDAKAMSALTKLDIYIQSLPPFSVEVYPGEAQHISSRGAGAQATSTFAQGIYNGYVLSLTPLSGNTYERHFSFCTDVGTTGVISIAFDQRSDTYCEATTPPDGQGALGGIIGPGFGAPSPILGLEVDKKVSLPGGGIVCAKKHPATGCIKYFYSCADTSAEPEPLPWTDPPGWFGGHGVVIDTGNLENPLCRETIFVRKGSPNEYGYWSNGKWICFGAVVDGVFQYAPPTGDYICVDY